jgi:uncharacterized membrane protein YccC
MTGQISDAREALAPLARDHSIEAERNVFLLVQAERIRLSILNLGRMQRRLARYAAESPAAGILAAVLEHASEAIRLIGSAPAEALHSPLEQLTADLVEFHTCRGPVGNAFFTALLRDARRQSVALRSQIRSAAWATSGNKTVAPAAETIGSHEPWGLRVQGYRARLVANLSFESTVFRHAVRMAVCLALGDAVGRSIGLQRTYWIAIVLKPDFTGTFARGVLRIGGTLAGLVLATLLFRFVHAGLTTDIALMTVFTLLLRWAGPANYGIFVVAMSGLVVLLISVTGIAPDAVIAARALNTALGGSLALLAYAVWPTWEKTQTRAALADLLDAYRAYTHAVLAAYEGAPIASIESVRVKARRARSNAEASVDRIGGEPGVTGQQASSLNAILVNSHSFVHAVMAMEARLYRNRRDVTPAWMPAFAASVETALTELSGELRNPDETRAAGPRRSRIDVETPPPGTSGNDLMETEADRVRTSLHSLGEELAKRSWL